MLNQCSWRPRRNLTSSLRTTVVYPLNVSLECVSLCRKACWQANSCCSLRVWRDFLITSCLCPEVLPTAVQLRGKAGELKEGLCTCEGGGWKGKISQMIIALQRNAAFAVFWPIRWQLLLALTSETHLLVSILYSTVVLRGQTAKKAAKASRWWIYHKYISRKKNASKAFLGRC